MLGLFKDTPVIGKANTIIQTPSEKLFNFIGNDLLTRIQFRSATANGCLV